MVLVKLDLALNDIVIDIQGDEPMINPDHINALIKEFIITKA